MGGEEDSIPEKYTKPVESLRERFAKMEKIGGGSPITTPTNSEGAKPQTVGEMRRRLENATPIHVPPRPENPTIIDLVFKPGGGFGVSSEPFSAEPFTTEPMGKSQVPNPASAPLLVESTTPQNELEARAAQVYSAYFGQNWQRELARYLFVEVHAASEGEKKAARATGNIGWLATNAEVGRETEVLIRNHVRIFSNPGDFELRTEIGESLYNLVENVAVTGEIPNDQKLGIPAGLKSLMDTSNGVATVDFCRQLLDRWNANYTQEPVDRYSGLNPDSQRDYRGIPEWKSEGFSDGIAVEIKRRSGKPLDAREQKIWSSFNFPVQDILQKSAAAFLPPVTQTSS